PEVMPGNVVITGAATAPILSETVDRDRPRFRSIGQRVSAILIFGWCWQCLQAWTRTLRRRRGTGRCECGE
ncbi:MAG TPA: hypothetical protein VFO36_10855, partial [Nitrospiraceae bacterium]|nr:hypothetical protein [Nitrospiraceae bacterium]